MGIHWGDEDEPLSQSLQELAGDTGHRSIEGGHMVGRENLYLIHCSDKEPPFGTLQTCRVRHPKFHKTSLHDAQALQL